MFLMSRNYTLYAFLPRDETAPAALILPGSGVYHLEHRPTWMPNISTYITRIKPNAIPPRDFEFSTEEIDEGLDQVVDAAKAAAAPLMPYPTRAGVPMAPRDQQLRSRYARHSH